MEVRSQVHSAGKISLPVICEMVIVLICFLSACRGYENSESRSITVSKDATLHWNANPEIDLAGYRIYYGTSSHVYMQNKGSGIEVRALTFKIENLQPGTYFFSVTAFDQNGNESGYSSEVSKVIQ